MTTKNVVMGSVLGVLFVAAGVGQAALDSQITPPAEGTFKIAVDIATGDVKIIGNPATYLGSYQLTSANSRLNETKWNYVQINSPIMWTNPLAAGNPYGLDETVNLSGLWFMPDQMLMGSPDSTVNRMRQYVCCCQAAWGIPFSFIASADGVYDLGRIYNVTPTMTEADILADLRFSYTYESTMDTDITPGTAAYNMNLGDVMAYAGVVQVYNSASGIPEPASVGLLGIAAAGLMMRRRES